uniref:Uncharacterized protein n=1 Tax=Anguilla anguilla TaxID=7936 RepID=A0A0E9Y1A7_ANGAN
MKKHFFHDVYLCTPNFRFVIKQFKRG